MKTLVPTVTCILMFTAGLFPIATMWKQLKSPLVNAWVNKMGYIYIQWDITVIKKRMKC